MSMARLYSEVVTRPGAGDPRGSSFAGYGDINLLRPMRMAWMGSAPQAVAPKPMEFLYVDSIERNACARHS